MATRKKWTRVDGGSYSASDAEMDALKGHALMLAHIALSIARNQTLMKLYSEAEAQGHLIETFEHLVAVLSNGYTLDDIGEVVGSLSSEAYDLLFDNEPS